MSSLCRQIGYFVAKRVNSCSSLYRHWLANASHKEWLYIDPVSSYRRTLVHVIGKNEASKQRPVSVTQVGDILMSFSNSLL